MLPTEAPSLTIYGQMQRGFDFLNQNLFSGTLPPVVLSLHRHPRTRGYFIEGKYRSKEPEAALMERVTEELDELALNPDLLLIRSDKDSLSTMAHEMVHEWISHFSVAARRGHHCKRWAARMKEIGLYPSSTGEVGGSETGSRVSHYIVAGGPFDRAVDALLATGFSFAWGSVAAPAASAKSGKRAKYVCGECGAAVWGKEDMNIVCGDCDEPMIVL